MALSEMSSELDKGRDAIGAVLRAARPRVQAEILHKLVSRKVGDAHRVSVAPDAKLIAQIEGILEGVSDYGLQTVESERQKQLKRQAHRRPQLYARRRNVTRWASTRMV